MTDYDRLTALDASFLHMERLEYPMHVGAMSVLEGAPFFDDAGHFRIDQLPEGPFVVTVWLPPSPHVGANGIVTYGDPIVVTRKVNVVAAKIAAMNVAVGRR